MTLFYDFNGLVDYEFKITDNDVLRALQTIYPDINIYQFRTCQPYYEPMLLRFYWLEAYHDYLHSDEGKYGLLDGNKLRRIKNEMEKKVFGKRNLKFYK